MLTRNVTVEGNSSVVLDLGYVKRKICLEPGIRLTLRNVILLRFRAGTISATPGLDIMAPSREAPDGGMPATLLLQGCMVFFRWCYPPTTQVENIRAFVRPAAIAGVQSVTLRVPQSGCSNSSSAPLPQRCWASRGVYNDLAMAGADMDTAVPRPTNYVVWLYQSVYACAGIMPEHCVRSLGPVGCFLLLNSGPQPPELDRGAGAAPPALPPAAAAADRVPAPGEAQAAVGPAAAPRRKRHRLLFAVVGVVGGVLLIALAVGAVALGRRALAARRQTAFAPPVDAKTPDAWGCSDGVWVAPIARLVNDCPVAPAGVAPGSSATGAAPMRAVCGAEPLALPHVVVSLLTPPRPDLALGVACGCGGEVTLLPCVRGRGSFGRVQEGLFAGQRVAVKLLPRDVLGIERPPLPPPPPGGGDGCAAAPAAQPPDGGSEAGGAGGAAAPAARPPEAADGGGEAAAAVTAVSACCRELASFAQEVEVLGRCCHPNVVRLLAACLGPPQPCLVMELMETSLDRLLHGRPPGLLPLQTVLAIALDVARGLEYLHPTIVHRDLKPANVLVNMSGPVPVAKLSDFGLSRLRHTVLATCHPEAGTPAYMAPECFDTLNSTITHQADIYSFSVILWEMLTGLLPWWGCAPVAVAYSVTLLGERLPLRALPPPRCPPPLRALLEQCFEAEPRRRPAAAELVKELQLLMRALAEGSAESTAVEVRDKGGAAHAAPSRPRAGRPSQQAANAPAAERAPAPPQPPSAPV